MSQLSVQLVRLDARPLKVEALGPEYRIYGLSAHRQSGLLCLWIRRWQPAKAVVTDPAHYQEVAATVSGWEGDLLAGPEGLLTLVTDPQVDLVVSALVGAAGIEPTLAAVKAGKRVALANKESLVAAGAVIIPALKTSGATLLPVDSEHSAIFQCLQGQAPEDLQRIHLTASGGPFRQMSLEEMERITPEAALQHPTWQMGGKITVDSATMMNKGLEGSCSLVRSGHEQIKVAHSRIVHSLIELTMARS